MPDELKIQELEELDDADLLDEIDVKLVAENLEDIYIDDEEESDAVKSKKATGKPDDADKKYEEVEEDDDDIFDADDEEVTVGFLAFLVSVMRIACVLLMGAITAVSIKTFWYGGKELGSLFQAIKNKDMTYLIYAGAAVVINLILILWVIRIIPKRRNGRITWYDKGQGFFGFVQVLLITIAAWPAIMVIEIIPWLKDFWWMTSVKAILEAINANHGFYLFCGISGTILSFLRKNL